MNTQSKRQLKELEEENRRLKTAVAELSILNEIATAIRSTQSLEKVIDLIVHKCVKHLHVEQGVVLLLDKNSKDDIFRTMIRESDQTTQSLAYRMDNQLLGWMIKNKRPLLNNEYQVDPKTSLSQKEKGLIKSVLAVPLISKNQLIGLLAMFNKKDTLGFNENDQRLLSIIATQSAQVIETARLFEEERRLFLIQEEMKFAYDIQKRLLPDKSPIFDGYDIAGISIPAKDVGGDYYDFIPISENKLAFCLGDVSGKGLPAALLMANLQATLRGQALLKNRPAECLYYANTLLYNSTASEKFVTLFYGIIDNKKDEMTFSNAGHDNPFLLSDNKKYIRLEAGGVVLGFMKVFKYEEQALMLKEGDVLLLYSDGITEAMNPDGEEYGENRLERILLKSLHLKAEKIIENILSDVNKFKGDNPQMDDMTLVVIRKLSKQLK